jgi:thiamine pyrophosphate-dependent acetolactate synthase large subunit-like protein
VRLSNAIEILEKFLDTSHIPVVSSLMGIDCIDHAYA